MEKNNALPFGILFSAVNGIFKEIWDKKIGSFISKRDLIADSAGIIVAALIVQK